MIPEFGHYALILALCVAIIQGVLPLVGAHQGRREWLMLARPAAQTVFLLLEPFVIRARFKTIVLRLKQECLAEQFDRESSK